MTDGRGPVVGDTVGGRYRLDAEIGVGGMAVVYRATDLKLGRIVAVKVFRAEVAAAVDPQRTTRETHLLAGVQHPAVVGALDASSSDAEVTYLVMELVEGDDLKTLLKRGPLEPDLARRVLIDVADALALLHAGGVVHRDVKPANILVVRDSEQHRTGITAKLTDFGIAQAVDGTRITATDTILGTAAYLSPEQVRGEHVGPATDVYAAGLVLVECLAGRRAFPGPPPESAVARLSAAPPIPPDASPELADLLTAMTATEPGERPTAAEVGDALRGLAGAMIAPDEESTAPVPRPAPSLLPPAALLAAEAEPEATLRHRALVPGIAAAAVLVAGVTGVLLSAPLLFGGATPTVHGAIVAPGDAASAGLPPAIVSSSPPPLPTAGPTSTPSHRAVPSPSHEAQGGTDDTGSGVGSSDPSSAPASSPPRTSSPPRSSAPPSSAPPSSPAPSPSTPATSSAPPSPEPSSPAPSSAPPSPSPEPTSSPEPEPTDTPTSGDSTAPSDAPTETPSPEAGEG